MGRGVTDRKGNAYGNQRQRGLLQLNGVSVGSKAQDPTKYYNQKAENYWLAREWLMQEDTKLMRDNRWHQFTWIKYKVSTDKVLQIEPKDDLKKCEGKSPDFAESLMLSFSVPNPEPGMRWL